MSRTRRVVFTYNNYPPEFNDDPALDAWLNRLGGKFCVAGRELAPGTGTPHLQGYIEFANPRSIANIRKLLTGCHVEPARGTPSQCRTYCTKDGNFVEVGEPPAEDAGPREKQRWDDARALAKEGKFDEIPSDIYIRYIGNLERIFRNSLPPLDALPTTAGRWLFGPTGSGKSRGVRSAFPLVYPKPLNKWWDGYEDQTHVLLDDVDHNQSQWIGNFLKIWADHYPFIAEKKGGSRLIRPTVIIVTSQYKISDLFNDPELVAALQRRFSLINVNKDQPIVW